MENETSDKKKNQRILSGVSFSNFLHFGKENENCYYVWEDFNHVMSIIESLRYNELIIKGCDVSFDEVLKNLNARDDYDVNRNINPLVKAKDAILIDNSDLSIKDQDLLVESLINEKKS